MSENLADVGDNSTSQEDRNTKKVRFKDVGTDMSSEMAVDFFPARRLMRYGGDKEETMVALLEKEKMVEAPEKFGTWMIVKRKFRRNPRTNGNIFAKIQAKEGGGSRFNALSSLNANEAENEGIDAVTGSGPKENHRAVLLASIRLELISGDLRLKASGNKFGLKLRSFSKDNRLEDCAHVDPTTPGLFESTMKNNPSILDPGRHSVVSFKENVIPNSPKDLEKVASGVAGGHPFSKGQGSEGKRCYCP
ncbi:hypothetical protein Goari_027498 [Gossypium aridum]|uniref:Uncharacterized protein n=1 Tax=Gossypium aridum TaxID=34290 RepID=A0A7J8YN66_GOSAI|nr:hypothetical protein [Gossypium aridum]